MAAEHEKPTTQDISKIARDFGFNLKEEEVEIYSKLLSGIIHTCKAIEELPELKPVVRYKRSTGFKPSQQENPFNAWYWKTDISGSNSGLLKGLSVGIKDAICVAGVPMTNGSKILDGYIPDVDATVVTRLLDAGAAIVGKTNAEDFCFSGGSHTCAHGPVRNPRKPTHTTGGSSSGSAAALAAGDVGLALGGDQGGSIRIPAAWPGVYGLKPTYGLVPYTGCSMIEMTLDHIGPMANNTEGIARLLSSIAGPDINDPRQRGIIPSNYTKDYMSALQTGIKRCKIGVVSEGFAQKKSDMLGYPASEAVVDKKVRAAIKIFKILGADVEEVSIPMHSTGPYIHRGIILSGATEFMLKSGGGGTNWSGFHNTSLIEESTKGVRERINLLPPSVRIVLFAGEYLQRKYNGRFYCKAQNVKHHLVKEYDQALKKYDLLVMPTVGFRARKLPENECSIEEYITHAHDMSSNTCQGDVTGHPSISVPCGIEDDLPIGLMITGRHFNDSLLISASAAFEKACNWTEL